MVPDNRDILFSGAVTTGGNPEKDLVLTAEVEHLTCFIGGMIGMGAKIFDLEGDLDLAKKLADGCVWAYGSFDTGIMPEGAIVVPCKSVEHCTWNETAYYHYLDPMADERDSLLKQYDENKLAMAAEAEAQVELDAEKAAVAKAEEDANPFTDDERDDTVEGVDNMKAIKSEPMLSGEPISLQKRQRIKTKAQGMRGAVNSFSKDVPPDESVLKALDQKSLSTEAELRNVADAGRQAELPLSDTEPTPTLKKDPLIDPLRPLSHKEFVAARIKQASLPPGFVGIRSRKYILR
jgi:mannosyl-oligosaccharide alpha-1,2-mannosidase